uniref:Glyoxalase domain-containing protein 4 n=1 Tax=Schistocephalus solidus TaxID=70667 RepID=A0A0X3PNB0_SCHSO
MDARALHFVFKITKRNEVVNFYKEVLGMKVLRHEEFHEGCKASCNGPYDGRWSKTMIGYGPEDTHFVLELTYNYGISGYKHGNDFKAVHINSSEVFERLKKLLNAPELNDGIIETVDPAGYRFVVHNVGSSGDPVTMVELSVYNLDRSLDYWVKKLGMNILESTESYAILSYGDGQCRLRLTRESSPIDRGQAFGRIAFSCPRSELPKIQEKMDADNQTILTRLVSLDTPGKATVDVVILADPDGHEICFVGDEAFRDLSQVDPKADELLSEAMTADSSDAWFEKRGGKPGL